MDEKEIKIIEYQEANKICIHYEILRRNGLVFLVIIQGALFSVLFSGDDKEFILKILFSIIGLFVGVLTLNNDIRLIDYYFGYTNRMEEIENELDMKLYSKFKKDIMTKTKAISNIFFFRGFSILISLFWVIYIGLNIFGVNI